jgi:hypothetical protein
VAHTTIDCDFAISICNGRRHEFCDVDGDPLADIDVAITKVRWVMKAGTVVVDKTNPTLAR